MLQFGKLILFKFGQEQNAEEYIKPHFSAETVVKEEQSIKAFALIDLHLGKLIFNNFGHF